MSQARRYIQEILDRERSLGSVLAIASTSETFAVLMALDKSDMLDVPTSKAWRRMDEDQRQTVLDAWEGRLTGNP